MLKKLILCVGIASVGMISAASAGFPLSYQADVKSSTPTFMLGIAVEFGDSVNKPEVGVTAKVISTNRPNSFAFGGGVSYFPWAKNQFGAGLDVGYNFNNVGTFAGYDFLRSSPQLSVGYVRTNRELYCGTQSPAPYELNGDICELVAPSDARLKHDIQLVDTLDDGTKIYSFKYVWSDETYVGVMAQDLLNDQRTKQAVVTMANGYYAVNYKALGLRMTTLERWKFEGRKAIAMTDFVHVELKKKAA